MPSQLMEACRSGQAVSTLRVQRADDLRIGEEHHRPPEAHETHAEGVAVIVFIAGYFCIVLGNLLWNQYKKIRAPYMPPDVRP